MQQVIFRDLNRMGYKAAWDYQENLLRENLVIKSELRNGTPRENGFDLSTKNYFLFVEHPPVYTLGKSGHAENILINESERIQRGIEFYNTNRGGDITFHGPGQVVGYPILDLEKYFTDIGKYLRSLEEIIILTLQSYGIPADRSQGETGVWIDPQLKGRERKICAMGIRCSRWITMHGFALNVNTDLEYFDHIIPCGIQNKQVTSIEKEIGRKVSITDVKERIKLNFEKVFQSTLIPDRAEEEYLSE